MTAMTAHQALTPIVIFKSNSLDRAFDVRQTARNIFKVTELNSAIDWRQSLRCSVLHNGKLFDQSVFERSPATILVWAIY
jgi:hypothetical protein